MLDLISGSSSCLFDHLQSLLGVFQFFLLLQDQFLGGDFFREDSGQFVVFPLRDFGVLGLSFVDLRGGDQIVSGLLNGCTGRLKKKKNMR